MQKYLNLLSIDSIGFGKIISFGIYLYGDEEIFSKSIWEILIFDISGKLNILFIFVFIICFLFYESFLYSFSLFIFNFFNFIFIFLFLF